MARLLHLLLLALLALGLSGAPALVEACVCCGEEEVRAAASTDASGKVPGGEDCGEPGCATPCVRCACGAARPLLVAVSPTPPPPVLPREVPRLGEGDRGRLHRPRIFIPPRQGA